MRQILASVYAQAVPLVAVAILNMIHKMLVLNLTIFPLC